MPLAIPDNKAELPLVNNDITMEIIIGSPIIAPPIINNE